jgi:hypothetical protein
MLVLKTKIGVFTEKVMFTIYEEKAITLISLPMEKSSLFNLDNLFIWPE